MADPDAMRDFLASGGAKLPRRRGNPVVRGVDRKRRPRAVSDKQQVDTDVVTGIMAERVWSQFLTSDYFRCECWLLGEPAKCWRSVRRVEFDTVEEAAQHVLDMWHPHHDEKRRKGPRANRRNVFASRSRPKNIFILHPDCHRRVEEAGS